MPQYFYHCTCGERDTRTLPMSQAKTKVNCACGKVMERDFGAEHGSTVHNYGATWPMCSDGAGVHPKQRKEAYEASVRAGVPTDFNAEGQAVFTSAKHKKAYCEAFGMYDRNGGYSDARRGMHKRRFG